MSNRGKSEGIITDRKGPRSPAQEFLYDLTDYAGNFTWTLEAGEIVGQEKTTGRRCSPLSAVCLAVHRRRIESGDYQQAGQILGMNDGEVEPFHRASRFEGKKINQRIREDLLIAVGLRTV